MAKRTVRITFFSWMEPLVVDGEEVGSMMRDATPASGVVEIPDADAARGDAIGAFVETFGGPAPASDGIPLASTEERARDPFSVEWLEASTADVILDAVAGDPDMARSMASIEEARPKPRTSLIAKLRKVKKD